jgi:hypothetical protein
MAPGGREIRIETVGVGPRPPRRPGRGQWRSIVSDPHADDVLVVGVPSPRLPGPAGRSTPVRGWALSVRCERAAKALAKQDHGKEQERHDVGRSAP